MTSMTDDATSTVDDSFTFADDCIVDGAVLTNDAWVQNVRGLLSTAPDSWGRPHLLCPCSGTDAPVIAADRHCFEIYENAY